MSAQAYLNKSFITRTAVTVGLFLSLLGAGCQPKSSRVYKVVHSLSRTEPQSPYNSEAWISEGKSFRPEQGPPLLERYADAPDRGVEVNIEPANQTGSTYHIGPGDVVQLKIYQLLDLNREEVLLQEVDRRGLIYVPMLNYVPVAGLTCEQVRDELIRRLGQEYIRDPQVDVDVQRYGSKQVMVLGAVRRPGALVLETDCAPLLDVISQAGGISSNAAPDIEILRRAYQQDRYNSSMITNAGWVSNAAGANYSNREIIPISKLFAQSDEQVNPVIYPGDVVKVPNNSEGFIYISGEIEQPGAKMFRRPLNIMQVVAYAGGLKYAAEEKKCKIVRRTPTGGEKTITVNLEKIRNGEQANLLLAQNDTITIPANGFKKFLEELDRIFLRGIRVGADASYNAGYEMGWPTPVGATIKK